MKQIDPSVLVTCAGFQGGMRNVGFKVSSYLLETAGKHLDYISVHNYWLPRGHHLSMYANLLQERVVNTEVAAGKLIHDKFWWHSCNL